MGGGGKYTLTKVVFIVFEAIISIISAIMLTKVAFM